jgi:signal transduction histidine kinase
MAVRSRSIFILSILFGYILLQFLWWEVLLVRQTGMIINEKEKLAALSITDAARLENQISELQHRKTMQTVMIAGEGTVFLLLLLFGIYKVKQSVDRESLLNNQQKNFFLSITHELKTPIAATKLQLQTLQKQKLDESVKQDLIQKALLETERLNVLIDNILFASRLDSKEFVFKPEMTDLGSMVRHVLNRYYADKLSAGFLEMDINENLMSMVDVHAFPSVITNLVDNAFKYSGEGRPVTVSLQKQADHIILKVTDHGSGIDAQDKSRVFERFFRAGNEETRRTKGTGLGLYIVDYIVRNHKGKVSVKDNTPGGSIFEVQLHAGS